MRAARGGMLAASNGLLVPAGYVQARGSKSAANIVTSENPGQPSGIDVGDLGIFVWRNAGATITARPDTSQGWSLANASSGFHDYKVYGSGEAAPSVTTNNFTDIAEALLVLKGVNATPMDATPSYRNFTSGTSYTGNSITSVNDKTFLVSCFSFISSGSACTITPPSGFTIVSATHGIVYAGIAYKPLYTSAITPAGTVVASPTWASVEGTFSAQIVNYLVRPA